MVKAANSCCSGRLAHQVHFMAACCAVLCPGPCSSTCTPAQALQAYYVAAQPRVLDHCHMTWAACSLLMYAFMLCFMLCVAEHQGLQRVSFRSSTAIRG
jgi:hypothetical protein